MPQRRTAPRLCHALAVAAILCLAACYEEKDETISQAESNAEIQPQARPQSGPAVSARPGDTEDGAAAGQGRWLPVGDARDPVAFMAEASDAPRDLLAERLDALAGRYRESPRMIANRVLQLWQDHPEVALPQLMADLLPQGPGDERSLGPVAQQYRVLRDQGRSHAEAAAAVTGAGR